MVIFADVQDVAAPTFALAFFRARCVGGMHPDIVKGKVSAVRRKGPAPLPLHLPDTGTSMADMARITEIVAEEVANLRP